MYQLISNEKRGGALLGHVASVMGAVAAIVLCAVAQAQVLNIDSTKELSRKDPAPGVSYEEMLFDADLVSDDLTGVDFTNAAIHGTQTGYQWLQRHWCELSFPKEPISQNSHTKRLPKPSNKSIIDPESASTSEPPTKCSVNFYKTLPRCTSDLNSPLSFLLFPQNHTSS